ncbi:MAG: type II secretion system protein [Nitrospiraceae bacterium]
MPPLLRRLSHQRGATYLFVMLSIVLMGISLSIAAKQWKVIVQRDREADLLAKGIEIQNALALYSTTMKIGRVIPGEVYPMSLAELTRSPKPFLRKVYRDPVGRGEWEYLRSPTGGIMGVRSRSRAKPIKQREFPPAVAHFNGLPTYRDWVFQHPSGAVPLLPGPPFPSSMGPVPSTTSPPQTLPQQEGSDPPPAPPPPPTEETK